MHLGHVPSKEQLPSVTRLGSGTRPARDQKQRLPSGNIVHISAICCWIWKIFGILVEYHVLSEPTDFCKDRSMYANTTPKIRGRGSYFPLNPVPISLSKHNCRRSREKFDCTFEVRHAKAGASLAL